MNAPPEASTLSPTKGGWFVFHDCGERIALETSAFSGRERVHAGGQVVSEVRGFRALRTRSHHAFRFRSRDYGITLEVLDVWNGELRCTLFRDGQVVDVQHARYLRASAPGRRLPASESGHVVGSPERVKRLGAENARHRLRRLRDLSRTWRGALHAQRNLCAGLRLALGLPVRARDFRARLGQLVTLPLLGVAVAAVADFLHVDPPREFIGWAAVSAAAGTLGALALAALLSVWSGLPRRMQWMCVVMLSFGVWSTVVLVAADWMDG